MSEKSRLQTTLESGKFAVSAELAPPKGVDFTEELKKAELLRPVVDSINVTDGQSASLKASSLSLCIELERMGLDPVLQMTGRDRNRIAIQAELLSAAHFGIKNVLALTGDHPTTGDNKEAKPVFEMDAVGILQAASTLMRGHDLGHNELSSTPEFFLGASLTPVYDPLPLSVLRTRQKIQAGAKFFQTQAIFSADQLEAFLDASGGLDAYLMAGIIPLKSAGMANFMTRSIPGIDVPKELVDRLNQAREEGRSQAEEGIAICADLIRELKDKKLCQGVHIMAIGGEENIPEILRQAGLT